MAKKVGDHQDCTYPYPNWQEVQPAFGTILAKLRGEDVDLPCLVHCGYAASGFALSMAFPHTPDEHPTHGSEAGSLDGQAAVEALAAWDGKSRMAIDWRKLAAFLYQLFQAWIQM